MSRDDVELQKPEDLGFLVPVFHTSSACAGAATAYVLRRIAFHAGAYAPGIQEQMFHELNTSRYGGGIDKVQGWFGGRVSMLHELGYRLQMRRVTTPTPGLLDWVRAGRGYRGAMLPTAYKRLHPPVGVGRENMDEYLGHAVGLTMERLDTKSAKAAKAEDQLVMIDPWPGSTPGATDRGPVAADTLELAHRDRGYHALVYFWVGWS